MISRVGRCYSPEEDQRILALCKRGHSPASIARMLARAMGRSELGIKNRIQRLRKVKPETPLPFRYIHKADLCDWYAVGWVVSRFKKNSVKIEWRHAKEPVEPTDNLRWEWAKANEGRLAA